MKNTHFHRNCVAAIGAVLLTTSFGAQSAPTFFLNDTIIRHIPAKDLPSFRTALGGALNQSQDGTTTRWSSTHASKFKQIDIQLTPLQTAETSSANTCRLLKADVARGGQAENWQFWFCKATDGAWKASGNSIPK
ncbi:hypothetical protein [Diaphorobacter sp. HDW4A]|uniref:hypothetical protein n=1 Tax=Diaphorobacter sp. HDW4A TaxID=2714924 RepID=UPI001F10DA74|nr:hypothetical protein [Diaphorobacter sp. HDW4A]